MSVLSVSLNLLECVGLRDLLQYSITYFLQYHRTEFFRKRLVKTFSSFRKPKDHDGSYTQTVNKPHTLFLEDPFNIFFYLRPGFLSVFHSLLFSTTILYVFRSSSVRFVILGHRSCSRVSLSVRASRATHPVLRSTLVVFCLMFI
jgi:hypothetical protein